MTDPEIEEVLSMLENIRTELEGLQEHPMVEGYGAEDGIDQALDGIDVAYTDVNRAGE